MKPHKQAKKARIYSTGSWLLKHEHMAQLLASTRHLPCLSLFVPWGSFIPSTKRETVFTARCVNSLPSFQQYLNCGYLNDSSFSVVQWWNPAFPSPPPPPVFPLQGHCGPPGRGASSFYDTAGCPVLSLHPLFSGSGLLTLFRAALEEQTCAAEHKQVSGLSCLQCPCFEDTVMSSSWVY